MRRLHLHVETTARRVTAKEAIHHSQESKPVASAADEIQALMSQLTPAERAIVELVRKGLSNKEIAHEFDKSIRTVKTQLTSIYKKFDVQSRSRLLARLS